MTFQNPGRSEIAALLTSARTIAIVGLSDNPQRPSFDVAASLVGYGYEIVPVNPSIDRWQDIEAHSTLDAAVAALSPGKRIDIVNVFRRPQHVAHIVDDCVRLGLPALWLQLGVIDEAAAQRAQAAGMTVVMNKCLKIERMRAV